MKKKFILILLGCFGTIYTIPPSRIPDHLYNDFSMNGQIEIKYLYFNGTVNTPIMHSKEMIFNLLEQIKQGKSFYYGATDTWLYEAIRKYAIKDKIIVIFGSTKPIYESICLFNEGIPITIEYNKWTTDHPSLHCITPEEYEKNPIIFDAAFSISSFEHDGLGRYGDPINPYADIETMQKVKKMIKPNGLLFLAVPIGKDTLVWNAHRIYGQIRLPLLLQGWQVIDFFGMQGFNDPKLYAVNRDAFFQPILVLKNNL